MDPKRGQLQESGAEIVEHQVQSKYICREVGVPKDPSTLEALREWADAWGEYTWQFEIENQPDRADESDDLKARGELLAEKGAVLETMLPGAKFYSGVVVWDGGYVELSK